MASSAFSAILVSNRPRLVFTRNQPVSMLCSTPSMRASTISLGIGILLSPEQPGEGDTQDTGDQVDLSSDPRRRGATFPVLTRAEAVLLETGNAGKLLLRPASAETERPKALWELLVGNECSPSRAHC